MALSDSVWIRIGTICERGNEIVVFINSKEFLGLTRNEELWEGNLLWLHLEVSQQNPRLYL